jgi:hypothetical protein
MILDVTEDGTLNNHRRDKHKCNETDLVFETHSCCDLIVRKIWTWLRYRWKEADMWDPLSTWNCCKATGQSFTLLLIHVRMSQNDMNTDTHNELAVYTDEVFDVSVIKTKLVSFWYGEMFAHALSSTECIEFCVVRLTLFKSNLLS